MLKPAPSDAPRPLIGRNGRVPFATLGLVVMAIVFVALAGKLWAAPASYRSAGPAMAGQLKIVGSKVAAEPIQRWAAIFRREHPEVRLTLMLYGAGTAADAMAEGEADLAPLVRPLREEERALVIHAGVAPSAVTVAARRSAELSSQPLYLYVKHGAARAPNPIAVEFVRVALSEEGQAVLHGSYAPIPQEMRQGAIDFIKQTANATGR